MAAAGGLLQPVPAALCTSDETKLTRMVASAATETACTTKRVLFSSEEPRGSRSSGMLLKAVT